MNFVLSWEAAHHFKLFPHGTVTYVLLSLVQYYGMLKIFDSNIVLVLVYH